MKCLSVLRHPRPLVSWRRAPLRRRLRYAAEADQVTLECSQWGITPQRNNVPVGHNIPTEWKLGEFDMRDRRVGSRPAEEHQVGRPARLADLRQPGRRRRQGLRRHQQRRRLAQALSRRRRPRLPALLRRRTASSSGSTPAKSCRPAASTTGRCKGICCAPLVEGERLWFVTSRGEVRCLDTEGFHDGENDGPFTDEARRSRGRSRRRSGCST